ncbi:MULTISPECIES: hypothetical protein [Ralstonia solanacearum species complex]|uniref:hypothetical protein n=1 Tax=Ralstonia solanacearum species complex TaxID=3116862 RepID=UPI001F0A03C6|nr:hypothetical protein [Ralstonia solanacearum]
MKISLSKWAARNYDPPPHIATLRAAVPERPAAVRGDLRDALPIFTARKPAMPV